MSTQNNRSNLLNQLDIFGRLLLTLLAAPYVAGFICSSMYLSRYGIYPISLVRTHYILAGFWVLFPIGTSAILWISFTAFWNHYRSLAGMIPNKRIYQLIYYSRIAGNTLLSLTGFTIIAGLIISVLLVPLLTGFISIDLVYTLIQPNLPVILFSLAIFFLLWLISQYIREALKMRQSNEAYFAIFLGSFCILIFIIYTAYFARTIYPQIPTVVGGGRPLLVQFLLTEPVNDSSEIKFLELGAEPHLSRPYPLLFESAQTYTVLSSENLVITFSKDTVQGIVVDLRPQLIIP